jgi:predicted transcriptional regulator
MNKKLEVLLERISDWPEEAQAELMQSIVEIEARHIGIHRLSDDERTAVKRGLQEMREGKFATDEQVAAVFNRFRS